MCQPEEASSCRSNPLGCSNVFYDPDLSGQVEIPEALEPGRCLRSHFRRDSSRRAFGDSLATGWAYDNLDDSIASW